MESGLRLLKITRLVQCAPAGVTAHTAAHTDG